MPPPSPTLPRATELAHRLVRERVQAGDVVVDATAGNGHDTLFLAERVGESGRVLGLDIQPRAIERTRERISGFPQVELRQAGHERLSEFLSEPVQAVMFNLGYLPSGDKAIITRAESTLPGLRAATDHLAAGGILTIVLYTGHEGGPEEAEAVLAWSEQLDQRKFQAAHYRFLNQRNPPPSLLVVERR